VIFLFLSKNRSSAISGQRFVDAVIVKHGLTVDKDSLDTKGACTGMNCQGTVG
jgi:hypothetical protein